MPFTLAHPAAVLPLRGLPHLRMAPLVVGTLVPDLPYYLPWAILPLPMSHYGLLTHAFANSFTIDLLLGYAFLAALFMLRAPLTALLSMRARALCLRALEPFRRPSAWAFAAPAILLGVWTHLLWDSFTHRDGWMVHRVLALSAPLVIGPYHGTVYHALQYLSSVVGLCVVVLWYDRLPTPVIRTGGGVARAAAGHALMLIVTAAVLIGAVQGMMRFEHTHSVYDGLFVLLTNALTWFAALYLTAGIVLTLEHGEPSPGAHD